MYPSWVVVEHGTPMLMEATPDGLRSRPLAPQDLIDVRAIRQDRLELQDLQFRVDVDEMERLKRCGCGRCRRRMEALDSLYL